jgi:hypothetical protein
VFTGITIQKNVLSQINRDNPTQRGLGWGIDIQTAANTLVSDNIFTDFSFTGNSYAVALEGDNTTSISNGVTVQNNLAYRINDRAISVASGPLWSNIKVMNNTIQDPDLGAAMITQTGAFASETFSGNTYSPFNPAHFAQINGTFDTYAQWLTQSDETGSQVKTNTFPDPGRSLDTYITTIGITTLDNFYAAIRTQSKANWHPEYTAATINNYIRAGFGLPAYVPAN